MIKSLLAPAKINLCLHVLGKRPDGYHDLAMLMQRVALYDRIELEVLERPGIEVSCQGLDLGDGEENIVARAARRLLARLASPKGVRIRLEKEIPVAAGLGGGSSDAAAVLMGLNDLLALGLSREQLMAEGRHLGADVPFFIFQRPAWATGIGDELEAVTVTPLWYVLINPGIPVSTAAVYRNLPLTSPIEAVKLPGFLDRIEGVVRLLHNDLERVTIPLCPVVAEVKEALLDRGAAGALMSGSGPTVFGVFADEASARRAAESLSARPGWRVFAVPPL